MPRSPDTVKVQLVDGSGEIDNFTSLSITNSMTEPSEASIEFGDDYTFPALSEHVALGRQYKVFVNGRLRLTGRIESEDVPADAGGGSVTRFVIKTKLSDACFTSAEPAVKVKNTSIKAFLLNIYMPLGYEEKDFTLSPYLSRDLITGVDSSGQGSPGRIDLEPLKVDQAKVQASESIFDAADRHLRRHGLIHWDSPDGRIVVGAPNDTQDPIYFLRCRRTGDVHLNNVISVNRGRDWSGIPSAVVIHGRSGKPGSPKSRITAFARDDEVYNAGLYRPIIISAEGIRKQSLADRAAQRELSARSKNKDTLSIETDSLSYWDGYQNINWAADTVCSMDSDTASLSGQAYYISRVTLRRDAGGGDMASLSAIKKGVWLL